MFDDIVHVLNMRGYFLNKKYSSDKNYYFYNSNDYCIKVSKYTTNVIVGIKFYNHSHLIEIIQDKNEKYHFSINQNNGSLLDEFNFNKDFSGVIKLIDAILTNTYKENITSKEEYEKNLYKFRNIEIKTRIEKNDISGKQAEEMLSSYLHIRIINEENKTKLRLLTI
ncbi:hypothetical protein Bp8pS_166 [Bacillus phage vB_BpuM-BpSp]|nr:hypothetical protein Bp8pS_166 [Bacillus phage vB_BpuM-BpSp]